MREGLYHVGTGEVERERERSWDSVGLGLDPEAQRVTVPAAVRCLFYWCPAGAAGCGLSEGQWPQLSMEGPVMNVQRQSRTLQQKQHQFSSL